MWKVYLLYWLAIVGATAAIKVGKSPWPPTLEILVPLGWMAALATLIVASAAVAGFMVSRHTRKRRRAIEALDALKITSAGSRAAFLTAAAPLMESSYDEPDELTNRLWELFRAIRAHPAGSIDFERLEALQGAARKQRELEAWSTLWQPSWIRILWPQLGPSSDAMLAATVGPLVGGGFLASSLLISMAVGPLWSVLWWGLLLVISLPMAGIAERRLDRLRGQFRAAAPELFSEDGSPKIPERYDRTRN